MKEFPAEIILISLRSRHHNCQLSIVHCQLFIGPLSDKSYTTERDAQASLFYFPKGVRHENRTKDLADQRSGNPVCLRSAVFKQRSGTRSYGAVFRPLPILHSHTCESYENTEGYVPSGFYRTRDENCNMISIGKHLAQCLEKQGVSVIHDTTVHDYPSYNDAYKLSRQTVQRYLEQYPTISLVLDIHRDAYEDSNGNQLSSTVSIDGVTASKLMIVAGTNGYDEGHPDWRENLSVAVKLHAVLEKSYPGLCRSLAIRSSAFNQDLSPGSLLIEVGTAGDTRQQALAAAEFLADGIAQLSQGSQ